MIERTTFGDVAGTTVDAFRLQAGAGPLAVEVMTYGATLVEVRIPDRTGADGNVVLRLPTLQAYVEQARTTYVGAVVGRWANRIAHARLRLGAAEHALEPNEGEHTLHGGPEGFHRAVWRADASTDGDDAVLRLQHTSPDGDQGFPGRLDVTLDYRVSPDRLTLEYGATTDADTVVNLSNHAYWNLSGGATVDDHVLQVGADRYLPVDDARIPTGEVCHVGGTEFDLRAGVTIGDAAFDHCFLLDEVPAARISHEGSGRCMEVSTDQPAMQVYTGDLLPSPRQGVCLEPELPPDAPNQPWLAPTAAVLHPGDVYVHSTVHAFPWLGSDG